MNSGKVTYRLQPGGDGYIVFLDGDRIGWVRKVGKVGTFRQTPLIIRAEAHMSPSRRGATK